MSLDDDARQFGQHFKQGGWRLGLLVARNVYVSDEQRGRSDLVAGSHGKVTANRFADKAGVSAKTVQLYYKAWQIAARDRQCTPAEQLSPGGEDPNINFEEDYDSERAEWSGYYQKAKGSKAASSGGSAKSTPTTSRTPAARLGIAVKAIEGIDLAAADDVQDLAQRLNDTRKLICELIDQFLEGIENVVPAARQT